MVFCGALFIPDMLAQMLTKTAAQSQSALNARNLYLMLL